MRCVVMTTTIGRLLMRKCKAMHDIFGLDTGKNLARQMNALEFLESVEVRKQTSKGFLHSNYIDLLYNMCSFTNFFFGGKFMATKI